MLSSSLARIGRRAFSTNLLEQLSLSQLKNEARVHGLSPSGNKASLITRIKHVQTRRNSADSATSIHRHEASTVHHTTSSRTSSSISNPTLDVKLPDLSALPELPGPHIPFLPDFWDSSLARGADAIRHDAQAEAPMRKVLVVAGTSTQHAGGPTYGSSDQSEADPHDDQAASVVIPSTRGFWADVNEDLGLPSTFDALAPFTKMRDAVVSAFQDSASQKQPTTFQSRPLDPDEVNGVRVLLLILGGSWLAGGLFDGSKKKKTSSKP